MNAPVDLRELAFERPARQNPSMANARRRSWVSRYLIPLAILLGFTSVLGWTLQDEFLPATPVTVLPVIVSRSKVEHSNAPLFQAAGWVEPRPTPVMVTSLVEGVIERVTVVEGQEIVAGRPVAYLIRKDAEIAVRQAEAELALKVADQLTAEAQLASAQTYFQEPIQLQADAANAEAQLAKVQTELSRIPFLLRTAELRTTQAGKEFEGRTKSSDSIARILVDRSQSDLMIAKTSVDEYREQAKALEAERVALTRRRDILRRSLELKVEETRQLAESNANVKAARAKHQHAQASLDAALLRLERMTILAPITGKVLSLVSKPGSRLMGLERAAMPDASTVITMYDPHQLQIRADVRLEDLSQVIIGQPVRIETPAASGVLAGHVIAITSMADIQKNTLQVKVSVDDPPNMLRPDMLVTVTYLAPPKSEMTEGTEPPLRLMIPRSFINSVGEQSAVWIVDPGTETASQRIVVVNDNSPGELVEITSGLHVGDRLIVSGREGLRHGMRIRISGEDRILGRTNSRAATSSPAGTAPQHHPAKPARLY